jgi:hypothetical protein
MDRKVATECHSKVAFNELAKLRDDVHSCVLDHTETFNSKTLKNSIHISKLEANQISLK